MLREMAQYAGLVSAVAAIVALLLNNRNQRFALGVQLLVALEQKFNSEPLVAFRHRAARALSVAGTDSTPVFEVVNFFEMVGLLLHRKALDCAMVWHAFGSSALGYWYAAEPLIQKHRAKDHTLWTEFAFLQQQMLKHEKRHRGGNVEQSIRAETSEFLEAEGQ